MQYILWVESHRVEELNVSGAAAVILNTLFGQYLTVDIMLPNTILLKIILSNIILTHE